MLVDLDTEDGRIEALRRMMTIRRFEETVKERFADGEIPGFVHLYIGEEAVGVGAAGALEPQDYVTSTHRGHGHCLSKGLEPKRVMAELFGSVEGYCRGKGGSMHVADLNSGMLGANGVVGAGPPLASGAALAAHLDGEDTVALSFGGDGSTAQGQFHEAVNLAATWDLPVIILIENNGYAEFVPTEIQHNVDQMVEKAKAYGIPGRHIDGMDITEVYEAVSEARERAIAGEGPTFIEAVTYRYLGHVEGDPQVYRSQEEVETWREQHDPIENYRQDLIARGELTEDEFKSLEDDVFEIIEDALEYARNAPQPETDEAYTDMYVEPVRDIEYHRTKLRADGGRNVGDPR